MRILYAAVLLLISMCMFAQNMPVAIDDTVYGMEQTIIEIYPLLNDYDLDGDTLVIRYLYDGPGEAWFEDSTVYYKSRPGTGWEKIGYKTAEKQNFYSHLSNKAYMRINLQDNPDIPVAVKDSLHAKYLEPTILYPLHNDYDPNGDPIKIHEIDYSPYLCDVEVSEDSTYVIVTSEYAYFGYASFDYSIIEVNTANEYISHESYVRIYLDENENLPIAVNDTMTVTGGIPTILDVLENDHDPLGDTLEFFDIDYPWNASLSIENNTIILTASTSFAGETEFEYSIRYKNNPGLYSQSATVKIFVEKNPDCPTGEPDYGSGMAYTYIPVRVLGNDHDPNGDDFEIKDVWMSDYGMGASISFSGDTVIYRPQPGKIGPDSCFYRIMKSNNPEYFSEPIPIRYNIEWNPGYPKTFPDSARVTGGQEAIIDFRSNDIIQDSIDITFIMTNGEKLGNANLESDSTIFYQAYSRSVGRDTIYYTYRRMVPGLPYIISKGEIYIDIENCLAYDSLNMNNINAGFSSSGYHFACVDDFPGEMAYRRKPHFEVPQGKGVHSIDGNAIWIGGYDENNQLRIAAEWYRNDIPEFQCGPVNYGVYDSIFYRKWNRIWNVKKSEVVNHIHNWWKEEYEMPEAIENWPGNREVNLAEPLAPYFDRDQDGLYNPRNGDYPLIRGDQCIFFILNDDKTHHFSQTDSLLVEIHGMAYAFNAPEDSILNNAIFIHYDIINKSENTYKDVYFGVKTDFSLGYEWDNYLGSIVSANSFYAYNDEIDGSIDYPDGYFMQPPAQSATFLAGPFMDADNQDNPTGLCDEGILGLNFSNGIIDDERHGMSYFICSSGGAGIQGEPHIGIEFYNYMKAVWKDGSPMIFGGFGSYNSGGVGPECRYLWPGDSDQENWGTNCELPNDGYNQDGKWWTAKGNMSASSSHGLGSSGPFTFHPGDVQEVDMAYVFANSYYSADSSVKLLGERLLELRQRTLDGEIIIPNNELNINEKRVTRNEIHIYPNPARETIYIKGSEELAGAEYRIYNMMGTSVQNGNIDGEISISRLQNGFYIMRIISGTGISVAKFIKN